MSRNIVRQEVLTLADAARYLRLPQATLKKYALRGEIPGRQIGKEWRFLKSALQDWLRRPGGKSVLLGMAGAFKDDETLPELRRSIQAARGRMQSDSEAGD